MNRLGYILTMSTLILLPILDCWAVETANTQALRVNAGATQSKSSEEESQETQRFSRNQWGLNETEWLRYTSLMKGIRGSISQSNLSPIEVLGIHAETDTERHEYAKKLAKMVKEDTERVLAFTRAYQEETRLITPDKRIINPDAIHQTKALSKSAVFQKSDRILFFTRIGDCVQCSNHLQSLLAATRTTEAQLDIFVVDAKRDADIAEWAKNQPFDKARLSNSAISLNHDHGTLSKVAGAAGTAPKIILIRNGKMHNVDPLAIN